MPCGKLFEGKEIKCQTVSRQFSWTRLTSWVYEKTSSLQDLSVYLPERNNTTEVNKFSFNESVLDVLKNTCGVGVEKKEYSKREAKSKI